MLLGFLVQALRLLAIDHWFGSTSAGREETVSHLLQALPFNTRMHCTVLSFITSKSFTHAHCESLVVVI